MIRIMMFIVLVSGTFFPIMDMVCCILKVNISIRRLILAALVLSAVFVTVSSKMALSPERILLQMVLYYLVIYAVLRLSYFETLMILLMYAAVTFTSEYVIVILLEKTLIGFKQLVKIDMFYAMTISLHAAILFVIDFFVKHRLASRRNIGSPRREP